MFPWQTYFFFGGGGGVGGHLRLDFTSLWVNMVHCCVDCIVFFFVYLFMAQDVSVKNSTYQIAWC